MTTTTQQRGVPFHVATGGLFFGCHFHRTHRPGVHSASGHHQTADRRLDRHPSCASDGARRRYPRVAAGARGPWRGSGGASTCRRASLRAPGRAPDGLRKRMIASGRRRRRIASTAACPAAGSRRWLPNWAGHRELSGSGHRRSAHGVERRTEQDSRATSGPPAGRGRCGPLPLWPAQLRHLLFVLPESLESFRRALAHGIAKLGNPRLTLFALPPKILVDMFYYPGNPALDVLSRTIVV